jgi:N-methylhydantoinase B
MKKAFVLTQLHHIFKNVLRDSPRSAVVSTDGDALYIRSETLSDIATLPATSLICLQYLQLGDGDVGLCNDPYSGGGILSNFSLVTGVSLSGGKTADILLTVKLTLKPRITNSLKLDEEGIRIPPTPIMINGELNSDILNAMSAHPQFPLELKEALPTAIKKLLFIKNQLKESLREANINLNKNEIKDFLKVSNQKTHEILHELAFGESRVEFEIAPKEKLKLRTEIHEKKVIFDFSGSDVGRTHFLTFAATFGACVGALFAFTRKDIPLNAGSVGLVEVVAPKGSIVNSNFPKPVGLGLTDGLDVVANLVLQSLSLIDKHRGVAAGGGSHCAFELRFDSGQRFYDRVHPGSGASASGAGINGHSLWWRARLNTSIEEIERRYPIMIESTGYRSNSGGVGKFSGGDGMAKTYRLLAPAELVWSMTDAIDKPLGAGGGKAALGPEMLLSKASDRKEEGASAKKIKLESSGQMRLEAGDQLWVMAAGGGGFGAAEKEK